MINQSNQISSFLQLLTNAQKSYAYSNEEVERMQQLTSEYLHLLDLNSCGYHTRAKVATAIRDCRTARRQHKDNASILEPLVGFLQTEKGKLLISRSSKHWVRYVRQSVPQRTDITIPESSAKRSMKKTSPFPN